MSDKRQLVLWPRADEDKTIWEDARSRGASADEGSEPESDAYYYQADSSKCHPYVAIWWMAVSSIYILLSDRQKKLWIKLNDKL